MRTLFFLSIIGVLVGVCCFYGAPAVGSYVGRGMRSAVEGTRDFLLAAEASMLVEPEDGVSTGQLD